MVPPHGTFLWYLSTVVFYGTSHGTILWYLSMVPPWYFPTVPPHGAFLWYLSVVPHHGAFPGCRLRMEREQASKALCSGVANKHNTKSHGVTLLMILIFVLTSKFKQLCNCLQQVLWYADIQILHLYGVRSSYTAGVPKSRAPGHAWWLVFVWRRLILVGPQHGTWYISPLRRLEFFCGS